MRRVIVIGICLSLLLTSCGGAQSEPPDAAAQGGAPVPVVSPEDPFAWFDKPLDGFKLAREPYEVVLHGSAYKGIAAIELSITGEPLLTLENPAPGDTLFTLRHTWTPPAAGRFMLRARTLDPTGLWSEAATVVVEVIEPATPTPSPTPPASTGAGLTEPSFSPAVIAHYRECGEQQVTAIIGATDPSTVRVMVVFYRLIDNASGEASAWQNLAMNPMSDGRFMASIVPAPAGSALRDFVTPRLERQGSDFAALVQMQFALQAVSGDVLRSPVYDAATLVPCAR